MTLHVTLDDWAKCAAVLLLASPGCVRWVPAPAPLPQAMAIGLERCAMVRTWNDSVWVLHRRENLFEVVQLDPGSLAVTARFPLPPARLITDFEVAHGAIWLAEQRRARRPRIHRVDLETGRVTGVQEFGPGWSFGDPRPTPRLKSGAAGVWGWVVGRKALYRFDSLSAAVTATIPMVDRPEDLVVTTQTVWAASRKRVVRIDARTNHVARPTAIGGEGGVVGHFLTTIAVAGEEIWVATNPGWFTRLDAATGQTLGEIRTADRTLAVVATAADVWGMLLRKSGRTLELYLGRLDPEHAGIQHVISLGRLPVAVAGGRGALWLCRPGVGVSRVDIPVRASGPR